ncbi:ABC-2 type transport system permease protein [Dysgonomonadaceae bacterium PH5-43]|nr:ABC-2 type transport system permease protein [Dysgonomonadaceae bacterium PH5-43]
MNFIQKEFCHILRDKRTVMILLIMPIIQIILFGFAISTEVNNIRVAIFDPSEDTYTRQIKERIAANPYFTFTELITNPSDPESLLRRDKADIIINFEKGFHQNIIHSGKASVQLIADGTDPNRATAVINYTKSVIASFAPTTPVVEIKYLYNPQMKSSFNFVPGVMGLILMLICSMMTSISIVREKEKGSMDVLLISPVKPINIILSKCIPYLVLSLVNLATILLLSVFLLEVPIAGSLTWLIVISVLFIFVALSLGLLISSMVETQLAAMLGSGMVLLMPVLLLSGMMFPIESMPEILQWISNIIPARWFISAVKKIMIEGLDITYVMKEVIILFIMAIVLVTVSVQRLQKSTIK